MGAKRLGSAHGTRQNERDELINYNKKDPPESQMDLFYNKYSRLDELWKECTEDEYCKTCDENNDVLL